PFFRQNTCPQRFVKQVQQRVFFIGCCPRGGRFHRTDSGELEGAAQDRGICQQVLTRLAEARDSGIESSSDRVWQSGRCRGHQTRQFLSKEGITRRLCLNMLYERPRQTGRMGDEQGDLLVGEWLYVQRGDRM